MPLGDEFDQDFWMNCVELSELLGEVIGSDALNCCDANTPGEFARLGSDGFDHGQPEGLHFLRYREQAVTILSQHESVRLSLEQLHRKVLLQLRDPAADGGVVDLEAARGGHEPALTRELKEKDQVVPIE